jgi:hypothetical protein
VKVDTWRDIDVYAGPRTFSSENQSFEAVKGWHLGNGFMDAQVQQIYDGGNSGKPGIICVPESGIDYPGKP